MALVSDIRNEFEGFEILDYPRVRQGIIRDFESLIQQLMQAVAKGHGLAIGIEEYEGHDFGKFELEEELRPTELRLFRQLCDLKRQITVDPLIRTSEDESDR